jgi:hypothetical protein
MKGRHVLWGMIASTALGLLARYCYLNWENKEMMGFVLALVCAYCLFTFFYNLVEDDDNEISHIFVPLIWPFYIWDFINELADKYLTVEEKENKNT